MKNRSMFKLTGLSLGLCMALGLSANAVSADMEKLLKECADCHNKDGNSTDADTPSIAGMSASYFTDAMAAYKTDARPAKKLKDKKEDMKDIVKKLSDDDIKALAAHFAKEKFKPVKQSFDAEQAKVGREIHKKYCDKCHSEGGSSSADDAGILAGQPISYLKYSMDNFASGKREMGKKMAKKFDSMKEEKGEAGITALINYYASQQ